MSASVSIYIHIHICIRTNIYQILNTAWDDWGSWGRD